jgi:toxin ParE1/3/4
MRKQHLKPEARADIRDLLKTSRRMFGPRAKRDYKLLIDRAVDLLCADPQPPSVQHRTDLRAAPHTFHLRHARRRGAAPKQARHVIVFTYDDATLTIIRVLHDSMDITQQITNENDES